MCLDGKYPDELIRKLPRKVTCYKIAMKEDGVYVPPFYNDPQGLREYGASGVDHYTIGKNTENMARRMILAGKLEYYRPYFHLFERMEHIKMSHIFRGGDVILKCEVDREDITAYGYEYGMHPVDCHAVLCNVIVARSFTLLGEV